LPGFFVEKARNIWFGLLIKPVVESDSSRFALKHFFVDFVRVSGFEGDSVQFALKHFFARSARDK
jgi:hypothetical protein